MLKRVFSKHKTYIIGKLLVKEDPEKANELLSNYSPPEPFYRDLNSIDILFTQYCRSQNIDPKTILVKTNGVAMQHKRLFLSAVVSLYDPEAFSDNLKVRYGLLKKLSKILKHDQANLSRLAQQTIFWKETYPEFRQQLYQTINLLKNLNNGSGNKMDSQTG